MGFVLKTKYGTGKSESASPLTAVENKIPDINSLVTKQTLIQKLLKLEKKTTDDNHDKYIASAEFDIFAAGVFTAILTQANLVTGTDMILNWKSSMK